MRVVGIVTEYNPLHNGHEYQIKQAREKYNADYIIVLMTGNFNQRGMPAIISKEKRADFAIKAGADVVVEFPVSYSLEDVPTFAFFAVAILNHLKIVTHMLFSSELGIMDDLAKMSEIITSEKYKHMTEVLKDIKAPSVRRREAFIKLGFDNYAEIINDPNNLFAVYFIAALKKTNSSIMPLTIKRIGNGYLDSRISVGQGKVYASATAIRKYLEKGDKVNGAFPTDIINAVPQYVYNELYREWQRTYPITRHDFWPEIRDSIEQMGLEKMAMISGMSLETASSIKDAINHVESYDDLVRYLKQKHENIHFHRRLFRILTRQYQNDIDSYIEKEPALYSKILAHSEKGDDILKCLKEANIIDESLTLFVADTQKRILANKLEANTRAADSIYMRVVGIKFGGVTI